MYAKITLIVRHYWKNTSILQRGFYMTIAWCQAGGIHEKMMGDVLVKNFKVKEGKIRAQNLGKKGALSLSHLIPSFIILAIGLVLSAITFCVEKRPQKSKRAKKGRMNPVKWAHCSDTMNPSCIVGDLTRIE